MYNKNCICSFFFSFLFSFFLFRPFFFLLLHYLIPLIEVFRATIFVLKMKEASYLTNQFCYVLILHRF